MLKKAEDIILGNFKATTNFSCKLKSPFVNMIRGKEINEGTYAKYFLSKEKHTFKAERNDTPCREDQRKQGILKLSTTVQFRKDLKENISKIGSRKRCYE
ncbi:hypothetical protein CEXT_455781 [Caerostris extrusa]|uniref:Uncharacterized protein n=1 Tax=Caerostris extrusa TaxID=172846 RepID=A0AAV4MWV2_CAEEX|nr:hypothetical protein CEXT_455781 [Caerostris extrusa]